jgi:hypothetical protein
LELRTLAHVLGVRGGLTRSYNIFRRDVNLGRLFLWGEFWLHAFHFRYVFDSVLQPTFLPSFIFIHRLLKNLSYLRDLLLLGFQSVRTELRG